MLQQKTHPVEFITVIDNYNDNDTDDCGNGIVEMMTERYRSVESSVDQGHISQLTLADLYDMEDDNSVCYLTQQPSLSRTYDSCDDSASFDLIADMISDDELSINLVNITLDQPTSQSNFPNSSPTYMNSAQSPITIVNKSLKRNGQDRSSNVLSKLSSRSQRLPEMKNKIKSLKVKYYHQRLEPTKKSEIPCTTDDVTDSNESVACNEYPLDERNLEPSAISMKQSMTETAGEIIFISCTIVFFYVIVMLYRDCVSSIIASTTT